MESGSTESEACELMVMKIRVSFGHSSSEAHNARQCKP